MICEGWNVFRSEELGFFADFFFHIACTDARHFSILMARFEFSFEFVITNTHSLCCLYAFIPFLMRNHNFHGK